MDRQTALDQLELLRMDGEEFQHPDFAEALAFLASDEEAREIFAQRQLQDREIAQAISAVSVPQGLKSRLEAALAIETAPHAKAPSVSSVPAKPNRRWILSASVVLATCLLAAVGVWFWGERPQTLLSLTELMNQAPYDETELAKLSNFDGEFDPAKPTGLWTSDRLFAFSSLAKGFAPNRGDPTGWPFTSFPFVIPSSGIRGSCAA